MPVPLELLDKYLTTFLDFWRLRPRNFLARVRREPTRFLPPAQFVGVSSTILLALLVIAFSLNHEDLEKIAGSKMASPEALAGRLLVLMLTILFANTLFYRMVSPLWPVRGKADLVSIFEFQCYLVALLVPLAAMDVLFDSITISLVANGAAFWVLFIPSAIGFVVGLSFYFIYQNPALAELNGVSSLRMFLGTVFWVTVPLTALGFVLGFLFAIVMNMVRHRARGLLA